MTRELQALHLFVFFLALLWVLPAPAATLTDRVVRVVDGDTLVVLSEGGSPGR
jgi:endonuclease YncB( thermonuclease family)